MRGRSTAMPATSRFVGLAENPISVPAEVAFCHSAIQGIGIPIPAAQGYYRGRSSWPGILQHWQRGQQKVCSRSPISALEPVHNLCPWALADGIAEIAGRAISGRRATFPIGMPSGGLNSPPSPPGCLGRATDTLPQCR